MDTLKKPVSKKIRIVPLPVVYYSPETKLGFGGLFTVNFDIGEKKDSTLQSSYIRTSFIYTLRRQTELESAGTLYVSSNKLINPFRIRYALFPEYYFGTEKQTPWENKEIIQYNRLTIENKSLFKINRLLNLGPSVRYDKLFGVTSPENGLLKNSSPIGYEGSESMGLGLALVSDKRNNVVNTTKGYYVEFSFLNYGGWLNNKYSFTNYHFDARKFISLSTKRYCILAFQFVGNFNPGNPTFKNMSEIGGASITRGYYLGFFRYKNMIAAQTEFRIRIWRSIGAVSWVGIAKLFSSSSVYAKSLQPTVGVGLRITINKKDNLNVRMDNGLGTRQSGTYLDVSEAF